MSNTVKAPGGQPELTQGDVIRLLATDAAARPYVLATLAALVMIFVVLFMSGSDLGGIIVVLFGAAAMALRWTAAPPFLLLVIAYFQLFPFGVPDPGSENPYQVRESHFQVTDMVLVMAVLVYLRGQYRLFGLVHQIVPPDSALKRKGEVPVRRPTAHIRPDELAWMLAASGALVLIGQAVWWLVNALEFVPMESGVPFRWADPRSLRAFSRDQPPGEFRPGQNRFFVLLGILFFGTLLVRLVFGYWRLRVMNASEGAMVLADTSWGESHRERVRLEKWRVWGRRRASERAEAAAQEARRREKEAARKRAAEEERAARKRPKRARRDDQK
ncbi:hypothetical protein R5W24_005010 [Gemmata sp. JC717]|uniref:hypothetical protein n=1 Tax=Gemmata algarum TaxID=2975278 RepID=UPI0021BABC33|nr:hypothetical protein [Gemmata algarum]MDY3555864.1 hypothetical protein [Gemmata algarum]